MGKAFVGTCFGLVIGGLVASVMHQACIPEVSNLRLGVSAEEVNAAREANFLIIARGVLIGAVGGVWLGWKRRSKPSN